MNNLSISYWANKYDCPSEADKEAIREAFLGKKDFSFTFEQKIELSKLLLCAHAYYGSFEEYSRVQDLCCAFNSNFAIDPLFYTDLNTSISIWKYNYKEFVSCIPQDVIKEAIKQTYNRLGYNVDDTDVRDIIHSSNIYSLLLFNLKEEANGRLIKVDIEDNPGQFVDGSFLNCYLLFNKLGLLGQEFFRVMARIGSVTPSIREYTFEPISRTLSEMAEEAKDRSRGRIYPTWYEETVLMNL